jgi:hypothetical protein
MKKITLLSLIIFLVLNLTPVWGQEASPELEKTYTSNFMGNYYSLSVNNDQILSTQVGFYDNQKCFSKRDTNNGLPWEEYSFANIPGSSYTSIASNNSVADLSGNGFIVSVRDTLYRYDENGIKSFFKKIDIPFESFPLNIKTSRVKNGMYIITAFARDYTKTYVSIVSNDNRSISSFAVNDRVWDADFDQDSNLIIARTGSYGVNSSIGTILQSVKINGDINWEKIFPDYGSPHVSIGWSKGSLYFAGMKYGVDRIYFFGKNLSLDGDEIWSAEWDGGYDFLPNVCVREMLSLPEGLIIIGLATVQNQSDPNHFNPIMVRMNGVVTSVLRLDNQGEFRRAVFGPENRLFVAAEIAVNNQPKRLIMKYKIPDIPTEVKEISGTMPENFELSQNYPNPFNPSTKINFSIPESNTVTIKVYDALGKEVATLVDKEMPTGNYSVDFNASDLSSGVYFYQLKVNNFIQTKKMVLMK